MGLSLTRLRRHRVHGVLLQRRTLILGLAAWAWLGWLVAECCRAQDAAGQSPSQQSSVTGSIKQGFNKVGDFFTPKPAKKTPPTDEATSLKTQGKPGPELYTAIARLYEEAGKNAEAEQYYQMALKQKPDDLAAILGYARFQENQGRANEALAEYNKAVQTHPKEPAAYNNLGLCFARRNRLNEAASALGQAVQLEPRNPLYRNNLATVLVDQNRLNDAFTNLREVHGEAAANYNLGYLLNKKGQTEAAEHYFAQALRVDPKMAAAQRWLNYLQDKSRETAQGGRTNDAAARVGSASPPPGFPARVISPPPPTAIPQPTTTPMPTMPPTIASTPPQSSSAATGPVLSSRFPPSASATYTTAARDTEPIKASPQSSDAPPPPPTVNSLQRLPPVSLRQPAGAVQSYPAAPNASASDSAAPMPPMTR